MPVIRRIRLVRDIIRAEVAPPRFTVVTPSFNQGRFLEATLRSVIDQDYPDVEYLVMDGGSTDESVEILRRYSSRLSYWVSEPDGGQTAAINKGFARATGDIFMWLNSDDLLLPGALRKVAEAFAISPDAGVVHGNAIVINERGDRKGIARSAPFVLETHIVGKGPYMIQPAAYFSRERMKKFFPLDSTLRYAMDFQVWLRSGDSVRYRYLPVELAAFRNHPQTKRSESSIRYCEEGKRVMDEFFSRADLPPRLKDLASDAYAANIRGFLLWNKQSGRPEFIQEYFVRVWDGALLKNGWLDSFRQAFSPRGEVGVLRTLAEAGEVLHRALAERCGRSLSVGGVEWANAQVGRLLLGLSGILYAEGRNGDAATVISEALRRCPRLWLDPATWNTGLRLLLSPRLRRYARRWMKSRTPV